MATLFCFGFGYSASHYIAEFGGRFDRIAGSVTTREKAAAIAGAGIGGHKVEAFVFDGSEASPQVNAALMDTAALLVCVPPGEGEGRMSPRVLPGQHGEAGDDQHPAGQDGQHQAGDTEHDEREPDHGESGPAGAADEEPPDCPHLDGHHLPLGHSGPPVGSPGILPEAGRTRPDPRVGGQVHMPGW